MKKHPSKIKGVLIGVLIASASFSQTAGALSFSYTPTSHSGYSGTKNVLAIWIQDGSGNFVKTRFRYAGNSTNDHLPTWAVNSGGSSWNCLSASCNVVDATTGATLTNFNTKNVSWDGTDVSGNIVSDGTYKITIESCWDHGSNGKASRSFTFTKGTSIDSQTPSSDANFTNISLKWTPDVNAGITANESDQLEMSVYPNPTKGQISVNHTNANAIRIYNLDGQLLQSTRPSEQTGITNIDLSAHCSGIYFVHVIGSNGSKVERIVLEN